MTLESVNALQKRIAAEDAADPNQQLASLILGHTILRTKLDDLDRKILHAWIAEQIRRNTRS